MSSSSISLFRSLIREAKKMNDYNFRTYALRRIKVGFRYNRLLSGDAAAAALSDGGKQLRLLQRQVIIGNLYPTDPSVMETRSMGIFQ